MGGIYEVRRWDGLRGHDIHTKFYIDLLRHSNVDEGEGTETSWRSHKIFIYSPQDNESRLRSKNLTWRSCLWPSYSDNTVGQDFLKFDMGDLQNCRGIPIFSQSDPHIKTRLHNAINGLFHPAYPINPLLTFCRKQTRESFNNRCRVIPFFEPYWSTN
jgi:hypothetical protein